ncbi:H(+)/Cl(-) exchange transporter 3 [Cyphellophora attinorum]|uniref:H(+)/Cl(-) exchange transporter 3 n=1 Tax=Cyphellophora attinorum TaxID=1664694 RepID=A0A0N1GXC4_9EURO|nr:H(+)/Cl(-) exchange transporter 3 [Phialophora attinorum]KPI34797.1 H(+)/Cl(-) exchange transporter 3 [Phialophora attinorum]
MTQDEEQPHERSSLLATSRKLSTFSGSHMSKEEQALGETSVGERLPYNNYTTIDWLHDLVKASYQHREVRGQPGIRGRVHTAWDASQGWIIAAISGFLTATIAAFVDLAVITVSDWKVGYCKSSLLAGKDFCCSNRSPFLSLGNGVVETCPDWHPWTDNYWPSYAIYIAFALLWGIISGSLTLLTRAALPAAEPVANGHSHVANGKVAQQPPTQKFMYMAAGSGIPEIKTILSGFVIPGLLSLRVLFVKAEGPFVHISVCVAHLVGDRFPKYANNGRKIREIYAAGCAAGLSVAFGAPIGGVLFAYEEISTYFPRRVMWRAFICSLCAAMVLRGLDPTGTGRLVLFETKWSGSYEAYHYPVFILLGILGGIFGGLFCRLNFLWSRWFRSFSLIKTRPVFEVSLIVLATTLLQFPNPLTREPGDVTIKALLVDCTTLAPGKESYICASESDSSPSASYLLHLLHGTLTKLILTTITFGIKVPSGIIIPSLGAGAFTGRLLGQLPFLASTSSPGVFAMVGAGAFLAGVSRMTISLAVIMFELTGSLEYTVPSMVSIMVAKWVADGISEESVYDLAQVIGDHPFLEGDGAMEVVRNGRGRVVRELCPPEETMREIVVEVGERGVVREKILREKLGLLKRRGLLDAGLVLVKEEGGALLGYLAQGELDGGLQSTEERREGFVRLLQSDTAGVLGVDDDEEQTASTLTSAPMEYAVAMFSQLGLRYLMITEEVRVGSEDDPNSGKLIGVVIKKRLVDYVAKLKHEAE